jgi:hypothetical protein
LLEFDGIGVSCSMAALIVLHSSTDSRIFSIVARESAICPSARWFYPLFMFAGLSTGLLFSSSSSELSPTMAST